VTPTNGARRSADGAVDSLAELVHRAVEEFSALSGVTAEHVSGLRSADDGWSVLVEVVDVERIPSTTSILSTYRVDADSHGALVGYERIRRYTRASVDGR